MMKHYLFITISTLFLASYANKTTKIVLKKCCPQDQKLSFTIEGLTCVKMDQNITTHDTWWWFPQNASRKEIRTLLTNDNVVYGSKPECESNSMDVLHYNLEAEIIDFSFHIRDNEIRLDVLKDSSFHDPDKGRDDSFPPDTYCVDAGPRNMHVVIVCPCSLVKCVRKCCADSYAFNQTNSKCVDAEKIAGLIDWTPRMSGTFDYYRLPSRYPQCDKRSSRVITTQSNRSQLLLFPNASIQFLDDGTILPADKFCGTYNVHKEEMVVFCMKSTKPPWIFILYGVLFLIGAVALLVTVIVTAILPEMRRNIHGRMALAHNVMLSIAYTATGVAQLTSMTISPTGCAIISFIIQYTILSAFFWLNVMCIDISWTFSGLRPIRGSVMQRDRKKFIYYSLYAWGTTAIISTATLIVEYSPTITRLKPKFGAETCFFNNRSAMFVFFYGPMALLLLGNLLLFMYTAFKIFAVKRDTAILTAKDSSINAKNKQKLILYVKLFCLMGVTYVTEVISWAVGETSYWWYFTDTINILRAVFIFAIFCCKRSVYNTIRDKVLRLFGKQVPNRNTSAGMRSYQSHTSCTGTSATVTPNANRKLYTSPSSRGISSQSLISKTELKTTQIPNPKA